MKILVLDRDRELCDAIAAALDQDLVRYAPDGEAGLGLALDGQFDVIVADAALPVKDGISLLMELRQRQVLTPVLMLSASDSVKDTVLSLDSGAHDCVSKRCQVSVLVAHIKALARRSKWDSSPEIRYAQSRAHPVVSILIAGDYESARAAMARLIALRLPGAVLHVADGQKNLADLCATYLIDIVITDLRKSPEALHQMIARIRSVRSRVRFIVTTGSIEKDEPVRLDFLDDCRVLRKPLDLDELLAAIEENIAGRSCAPPPAPAPPSP